MRPEAFEVVDIQSAPGELPFVAKQSSKRGPELLRLACLSLLAAAIVLPQLALAGYALVEPQTRALILEKPLMTAELTIAILFWIALFAWPLRRLLARVNGRRSVEISRSLVAVKDDKLFGSNVWVAPLASYTGIVHRVRASLSGSRHELVLLHPESAKSVLLKVSALITEAEISRFSQLFGVPQIKAGQPFGTVKSRPERNSGETLELAEAA